MKVALPNELTEEKKYRHFSFGSITGRQTRRQLPRTGAFFYVGTDAARIEKLLHVLDGKFEVENVANVAQLLKLVAEKDAFPATVMVDGKLGKKAIRDIYNYLTAHFSGIPLLVDASDASAEELNEYRKITCIDDITFLKEISGEKLVSKINFLKKVKNKPVVEPSILLDNIQHVKKIPINVSRILKRAFDIAFASIAILALLPIFLIIALAIRIESKGPIFYIAKRAGKGYKIFKFYKFRTMVVDADKRVSELSHLNQYSGNQGPVFFKVSNDPRITKIGAFLRNTSLDELPQLFNVLLGDMSLVGNRPLPLYEAAMLTTDQHAIRFMAPAGITGLWQIKKRGTSNMSVEERINLDIDYANKSNFIYDLWIIANTPSALLQKENV
jgi:lipopolysaccharide/colanic/teichoic acid biosynthesis glycosyltransferase